MRKFWWLSVSILMAGGPGWVQDWDEFSLEVMNPRGKIDHLPYRAPNPRVTDLSGKKIGLYCNGKAGGDNCH